MISRFISQFHQFWCDSSESEVFYTSDSDTNACGTKNWKNKYVHTYGTKSQKLVKNWIKIHFFACVPFVCTYCENFDMILRSYIVSLTYFDFNGKALKVVKLWNFEVWHSFHWRHMQTPFKDTNASLSVIREIASWKTVHLLVYTRISQMNARLNRS